MDKLVPLFSPQLVYSVKVFKANGKSSQEHIFIGNLLNKTQIQKLERGNPDNTTSQILKEFNVKTTSGNVYHQMFINFYDSWEEVIFKIQKELELSDFYLWSPDKQDILTHEFIYQNKTLPVLADPFSLQPDFDFLFKTFTSLKTNSLLKQLVRDSLTTHNTTLNLITIPELQKIQSSDNIKRFYPEQLNIPEPYYNLPEAACLDGILRNEDLPALNTGVNTKDIHITQCTIHINYNENPNFINLETIFQLIPTNNKIFFTKLRIGARSLSKVSRDVVKYKNHVTKTQLSEWSDPEKHEKGLLYRKIKESGSTGLVIYTFHANGFIEMKINWNEKTANQLTEINQELSALNNLISQINNLRFHLPGFENKELEKADLDFVQNPESRTYFTSFNFNAHFDTSRKQIIWSRFQHLAGTWSHFLTPIYIWRVYNGIEFRRVMDSHLSKAHFLYTRTSDTIKPHPLNSILYSLGLIGGGQVSKEQTVKVGSQKSLILQNLEQFKVTEPMTSDELEDTIKYLKESNQGVLINIYYDPTMNNYGLEAKGTHDLWEIQEITYIVQQMFRYYFQIEEVFKLLMANSYDCQLLNNILDQKKPIGEEKITEEVGEIKFDLEQEVEGDFVPAEEDEFGFGEPGFDEDFEPTTTSTTPLELSTYEEPETKGASQKVKSALEYLQDISDVFKQEYARTGCVKEKKPVVISLQDFWKNYNRLINKVDGYKDKMKPNDKKEFEKKYKDELEAFDSGANRSISKLIDRIGFIVRHTESSSDVKILKEIITILERYDRGLQMKVPKDKEMSRYTEEHFYFCPINWCYFCRISRTSDEIEDGKCSVCKNRLFQGEEGHTYIAFPTSKTHRHINCLPCCFKKPKKKKILQCQFSHPTDKVAVQLKDTRASADHILRGKFINADRHGYLDGEPTGKLNDHFNKGAVFKTIGNNEERFVRRGVKVPPSIPNEDVFLEAISQFQLEEDRKKQPLNPEFLRKHLTEQLDKMGLPQFLRLNNGLIATIFLSDNLNWEDAYNDYYEYIAGKYVNEDLLWHLISLPGVIYKDGLNLLIIKKKGKKYSLLCPPGLRMEDYYDPGKPVAMLLKMDDNLYQPIVKLTSVVDYESDAVGMGSHLNSYNLFDPSKEPAVSDLLHYAIQSCQPPDNEFEKNRANLQIAVESLKKAGLIDDTFALSINQFQQATHIIPVDNDKLDEPKIKIPIKSTPSPAVPRPPWLQKYRYYFNHVGAENLEYVSVVDLFKALNKLEKTKLGATLRPSYYMKNENDEVHGLKFDNLTYSPVSKIKVSDLHKLKVPDLPTLQEELPEKIDKAIALNDQTADERAKYAKLTKFQREAFQRLRFELGHRIGADKKIKTELIDILKEADQVPKDRKKYRKILQEVILPLIKDISTIMEPDLTNYKTPQIRNTCQDNKKCLDDPHCHYDEKTKKCVVILTKTLILPHGETQENSYQRYAILISDELLRNQVKRAELLQGKVSFYVNPGEIYYNVANEIFLSGQADDPTKLKELYQREQTLLDKMQEHYFKKSSEVFSRGAVQTLFYLDKSWYDKTDLSPDEFIYNRQNVYDVLGEALHAELGTEFWTYIEKHNWKHWLSALRQILPDEYANIYKASQFMEHLRYSKGYLTDLHLALLSHLYDTRIIIMNEDAKNKFKCLGTTQSLQKYYLVLYNIGDTFYLVGKTPHLDDLFETGGITYQFKETDLPQKFIAAWKKQCGPEDAKIRADPVDYLLRVFKKDEELDQLYDDREMIKEEKIVAPPGFQLKLKPTGPEIEEDEEEEEPKKPVKPLLKLKPVGPKLQTKPVGPKLQLKLDRGKPTRPKLNLAGKKPSTSRTTSRTKAASRTTSRTKAASRSTSRGRSTRKSSRTTSRSTSRGRSTKKSSRAPSRSTSRGKAKPKPKPPKLRLGKK